MFDLIDGLPVHPLVVHAVVVLLPLAIIGTLLIAAVPRWRRPYGPVVLAVALVATVLIPVSTSSGEALERHVGNPGEHAELGGQLIWFALPLLVLVAVLVWLDRRADGPPPDDNGRADGVQTDGRVVRRRIRAVVAGLAVVAALAAGVQVYRVGDSGARAAWGGQVSSTHG